MSDSQLPLLPTATDRDPQQVLESLFGFREFRPGQRRIIEAVLAGRDCIGVMPTGAGKSLTFQIPARLLPGTVLVLSPLISLMKDQVDALERYGFKAAYLNSSLGLDERRERLGQLRRGELELLYLAPEALEGSLRSLIAECPVSLVVVDEAHCISQWGHDFRPAYRKLRGLKQELGDIPVLALTATATRQVAGDILRQLGMRRPDGFKGSFFRSNLRLTAVRKGKGPDGSPGREFRKDLLGLLRAHSGESAIVYCISRKSVEQTTEFLRAQGVRALPYHAGLEPVVRTRHQDAFARDEAEVIVATVAFGMGIDKGDVRLVVHRDMPKSIEAWYQEIGRAGRDGLPSDCVTYYSYADVIAYDGFLDAMTDDTVRDDTRRKTLELFRLLDRAQCRHQGVCAYFDESREPCAGSCDICLGRGVESLVVAAPSRTALRTVRSAAATGMSIDTDPELFERLRALRKRIAEREGVPAYIVFGDSTLVAMATQRPRNREAMLLIPGVGPVKLERYGEEFLREVRGE